MGDDSSTWIANVSSVETARPGKMRERAFIHVAGPVGAGKTAFIEALLVADLGIVGCMRCRKDPSLSKERETVSRRDPELRRYAEAGASRAALFRFPQEDAEGFWDSDFGQDYLPNEAGADPEAAGSFAHGAVGAAARL